MSSKLSATQFVEIMKRVDIDKVEDFVDNELSYKQDIYDNWMTTCWEFEDEFNNFEYGFLTDMQKRFNVGNYQMTGKQHETFEGIYVKYERKQSSRNQTRWRK